MQLKKFGANYLSNNVVTEFNEIHTAWHTVTAPCVLVFVSCLIMIDLFFKQKYMLIYNRYMKRCLRFFVKKNSLCALIACYPLHIRKHFNVSFLKKAVLKVQTPQYKLCAFVSNYISFLLPIRFPLHRKAIIFLFTPSNAFSSCWFLEWRC